MSMADTQYLNIVENILDHGYFDNNRTGVRTYKLPHQMMQFDLEHEFPILTTKFVAFKTAVKEILWIWQLQSNDVREPFNEDKLRSGMLKALEKRPVSADDVEMALNHIKTHLRGTGEREVPSKMIGNLVMEQLKKLDKVAYIRFASVYRSFEDIKEFGEEIARLQD